MDNPNYFRGTLGETFPQSRTEASCSTHGSLGKDHDTSQEDLAALNEELLRIAELDLDEEENSDEEEDDGNIETESQASFFHELMKEDACVKRMRKLLSDNGRFHDVCTAVFERFGENATLPSANALRSAINIIMDLVKVEHITEEDGEELFLERMDTFEFYTTTKMFCESLCRSLDGSFDIDGLTYNCTPAA